MHSFARHLQSPVFEICGVKLHTWPHSRTILCVQLLCFVLMHNSATSLIRFTSCSLSGIGYMSSFLSDLVTISFYLWGMAPSHKPRPTCRLSCPSHDLLYNVNRYPRRSSMAPSPLSCHIHESPDLWYKLSSLSEISQRWDARSVRWWE